MQQNVRMAMTVLAADLRMAGFGFSMSGNYTSAGGTIYAVTPTNSNISPDSITIRYGVNPDPANPNTIVTLTNAMANSNSGISLVVSNVTGFAVGDTVLISDGQNASCLLISGVPSGNTLPYTKTAANIFPTGGFAAFSHIYKLKQVSYQVANIVLQSQTNGGAWQDVVNNIEDLQLAYQGTSTPSGTWVDNPNPIDQTTVTNVQLNILARSNNQDFQFTGQRPLIRDHAAGSSDHYRRRLLTSTISIRNL
jgi:Tfp pilus assembly protein PilW